MMMSSLNNFLNKRKKSYKTLDFNFEVCYNTLRS